MTATGSNLLGSLAIFGVFFSSFRVQCSVLGPSALVRALAYRPQGLNARGWLVVRGPCRGVSGRGPLGSPPNSLDPLTYAQTHVHISCV